MTEKVELSVRINLIWECIYGLPIEKYFEGANKSSIANNNRTWSQVCMILAIASTCVKRELCYSFEVQ
jgi:hypothetical protein